ncbi:hypothetical protein K4A83_14400 [Spirulina subsalsa FACHB-351]|jgi:hypothetical protein|uniref:Uncharacterized protein n=1 Tax=Spirulina subsalsa FACHB-351 TaxID=234711 RepID=A0ABT3L7H4_9CYAN|nr:hypothetical protein [Spirulina subsalsa FACHB-351]
MAGIDDFDEDDWRELLAELRLVVVSFGFIEWDASMTAALEEEEEVERDSAHWQVIRYAKSFSMFLTVRSAENLKRMRDEFAELVRTERAQPVTDAIVLKPDGEEGVSVLDGPRSDDLIAELKRFVDALREDTGYFDDPEFEE